MAQRAANGLTRLISGSLFVFTVVGVGYVAVGMNRSLAKLKEHKAAEFMKQQVRILLLWNYCRFACSCENAVKIIVISPKHFKNN